MSATLTILSREYLYVPVTFKVYEASTLDDVSPEFAFKADSDTKPADADWKAGDWEPGAVLPDVNAIILIGPGSANDLGAGVWSAWFRVTGAVERPVRKVGLVQIT